MTNLNILKNKDFCDTIFPCFSHDFRPRSYITVEAPETRYVQRDERQQPKYNQTPKFIMDGGHHLLLQITVA